MYAKRSGKIRGLTSAAALVGTGNVIFSFINS